MFKVKLPETDVAEEPGPERVTQDQSSHEDVTSDWPENNARTPVTHHETDTSKPLVVSIKSEPVEDADVFPGLNTEPVNQNGTSNVSHQFQSEPVERTESEVGIKHETYFYIDLSSTPVNPWAAMNPKYARRKSWKKNISKVKCKPFTCIELNTSNTSSDFESKPVRMNNTSDVKDETFTTNSDGGESDRSNINSDVKMEPVPANTSSDAQTEAVMDTMATGMHNIVRSESISSVDEDQVKPAGDEQECEEPFTDEVPSLDQPATFVKAPAHKFLSSDVYCETSTSHDSKRRKVIHTGQRRFMCDVCFETFTQAYHLKRHKMSHTGERPFVCDVCPRSFTQASDLKRHKMIHTGQRPFVCDVCYKTFTQSGTLKTHKMIHINQKPFVCDMCNETLPTAYDLKTHKLTHTPVYVCDVCFNTFTRLDNLKAHKKIHTGQRPFACDMCSKTFTMSQHLKKHKRIHTGERPFVCVECNKTFARSDNLKTHMLTHTGQKPFVCDVCNKTFTQAGNLKTHKKTHNTNHRD